MIRATGVTTAVVERMEESLKRDVLREVRASGGRILLHDEVEERPGVFSIIPIWENVSEEDIMTPRNVFELMVKEGYHVRVRSSSQHPSIDPIHIGGLRPSCSRKCDFSYV